MVSWRRMDGLMGLWRQWWAGAAFYNRLRTTPWTKHKGTFAAGKGRIRGQFNCRQRFFPRQFGLRSITLLAKIFAGSYICAGNLYANIARVIPADRLVWRQVLLSAGNTSTGSWLPLQLSSVGSWTAQLSSMHFPQFPYYEATNAIEARKCRTPPPMWTKNRCVFSSSLITIINNYMCLHIVSENCVLNIIRLSTFAIGHVHNKNEENI
jgi:hypothetical protein